jgi:hypothetical protein
MSDSAGAAGNDEAFLHAHDNLIARSDYQFSLPDFAAPKVPDWLQALAHFLQNNWVAIKWGSCIVAGLILCYVIYALVRKFWPLLTNIKSTADSPQETEEEWRPTPAQARQLLSESDALAARGLYSEAVHLLLLRSIEDIDERRPHLVQPMLTSREIARLRALPEQARAAFGGIAQIVERALFAGDNIGAVEFARCRKDYESFAFPALWQIGAAR